MVINWRKNGKECEISHKVMFKVSKKWVFNIENLQKFEMI